jgi:tetratricopeptide (TPR) repeat protein
MFREETACIMQAVTFEEVERLLISGCYGEVLKETLREQAAAEKENRGADFVRWSLLTLQACRYMGRTNEALQHAYNALEKARTLNDPALLSQAHLGQAVAFKSARDYDEAISQLKSAIDVLPAGASDLIRAGVLLETAETSLEAGLRPEAEAALAKGGALVHWLREPRLLAWSLYLRSQWEDVSPADLQLSAAYEIAKTVDYPELQWQILWKLAERAGQGGREKMQEDCLWNAFQILTRLAEPLEPADATAFWRQGSRRLFMESAKRKFGGSFFERVKQEGVRKPDNSTRIIRDLGFDSASIPDFGRREPPQEK